MLPVRSALLIVASYCVLILREVSWQFCGSCLKRTGVVRQPWMTEGLSLVQMPILLEEFLAIRKFQTLGLCLFLFWTARRRRRSVEIY